MRQTFIFIISLFVVLSCINQKGSDAFPINTDKQIETTTFETIDLIKKNVEKISTLNLSISKIDLSKLKTFSSEFLIEIFAFKKIIIGFPEEFNSNYPETYYFYQGKEFDDYYLMTFIHTDETCCKTLYGATFSNTTDSLINIAVFAYSGGDGGWYGMQTGKWKSENRLATFEFSEYDDDIDQSTINSEIDSIWNTIEINKKGEFKLNEIKKLSYLGDQLKL
jgi:hypothetical protein